MKCFPLIATVLDELYEEIPGSEAEKDALIVKELNYLTNSYGSLTKAGSLDYGNPVRRFAYIYKYVVIHSIIVYQTARKSEALQDLLLKSDLSLTCVGGGPGSDFLGVLKWLILEDANINKFRCAMLDRERAWCSSWFEVDSKADAPFNVSTFYDTFDAFSPDTWTGQKKYLGPDLITFIYFFSELFWNRDEADKYFNFLFANIKPGTKLLFADNNSTSLDCASWFRDLCTKHSIKILEQDCEDVRLPGEEQKDEIGKYFEKFKNTNNARLKLTANLVWIIGIKE